MNYRLKTRTKRYWPGSLLLAIICSGVVACDGGISGTGDGGPIVIVDNSEGTGSDTSDMGSTASSEADGSTLTNGTLPLDVFPPLLLPELNNTLLAANDFDSRFTVLSLSQQLSIQITAAQQQSLEVVQHLVALETQLIDSLVSCDNTPTCDTLPVNVTIEAAQDSDNNTTTTYSEVSYLPQTAGYFDKQLTFTNNAGTTVLRWTTDRQLISLVTENNSALLYLFSDLTQSQTTFRREEKSSGSIVQSVFQSTSDAIAIEADLHGDQQHYIRASMNNGLVNLYAIHPTDPNVKQLREGFNLNANQYAIDSCTTGTEICTDWQTDHGSESASTTLLENTQSTTGNFSVSMASDLTVNVPATIDEYIITPGTDQSQPAPRSLICGGQRVQSAIRNYCWQPLPLESAVQFFEEEKTGNSIEYRLLPNASIQ